METAASEPRPSVRRWLLHVDLDQFLAAVEVRRRPELRGRPVIVGGSGDPTERRKVVTCASYEARGRGVHAGMALRAAFARCPEAAFLASDNAAYEQASGEVMALLRTLPVRVEEGGWDEAFLAADTDDPNALAACVQQEVARATGLSSSIGIGDTKPRAKVATGFAKPGGIYRLTVDNWIDVMGDRPAEALWGIGRRTANRLAEVGVLTVADLARADVRQMRRAFGPSIGPWLILLGRGIGASDVVTEPRRPKGRSRVTTFPHDLTDPSAIEGNVAALAVDVAREVIAAGRSVRRVAVTIRTSTFFTRTKITTLPAPTVDVDEVERAALRVLGRFHVDRPVRLLGVRVEFAADDSAPSPPAELNGATSGVTGLAG
jgi:DNA polymerase IV